MLLQMAERSCIPESMNLICILPVTHSILISTQALEHLYKASDAQYRKRCFAGNV